MVSTAPHFPAGERKGFRDQSTMDGISTKSFAICCDKESREMKSLDASTRAKGGQQAEGQLSAFVSFLLIFL